MKNPVGSSSATTSQYVGASPTRVPKVAHPTAAPSTSQIEGRLRRPVPASAPTRAPTASAVVNRPNEAAPVLKTVLASAARVSWKLNRLIPITDISAIGSSRSERRQT